MSRFSDYRLGFFCLVAIIVLLCIVSCSKTPNGVLPQDKMARVLADMHIAESVADQEKRTYNNDSMKRVLKQSVLEYNGVTTAQFDSSLSWYGYNLDQLIEVYDKVIALLEEDMENVKTTSGSAVASTNNGRMIVEGDSVDVWPDLRFRRFSTNLPSDMISFALNSDQNWEKGDVYNLSARMTGSTGQTELTIVSEYQDGSKDYNSSSNDGDGWHSVVLALNPEKSASSIYGILRYNADQGEQVLMDSIRLYRSRNKPYANELRKQQKSLSGKYGR